jgi:CRISPR-associated protein Cas2
MSKQDEPVWSMVMFDLPVKSKPQRSAATQFRNLLLDQGYQMAQYSVYVRFSPNQHTLLPTVRRIKANVPDGGEVRVLTVTDHQWSTALRFFNNHLVDQEDMPVQLAIF